MIHLYNVFIQNERQTALYPGTSCQSFGRVL